MNPLDYILFYKNKADVATVGFMQCSVLLPVSVTKRNGGKCTAVLMLADDKFVNNITVRTINRLR